MDGKILDDAREYLMFRREQTKGKSMFVFYVHVLAIAHGFESADKASQDLEGDTWDAGAPEEGVVERHFQGLNVARNIIFFVARDQSKCFLDVDPFISSVKMAAMPQQCQARESITCRPIQHC
jgi:hypothetical protein